MLPPFPCSVCAADATTTEGRMLWIYRGCLLVGRAGLQDLRQHADEHRSVSCGQMHTLVLAERFLERGTFAPADFTPQPTEPTADTYAELSNA